MTNITAFLDMLAISELGQPLMDVSDNGYNVIVGSTAQHPHLFTNYADHPRILVDLGNGLKSTAAGRYQILERYYDAYKTQLDLLDFGCSSQDAIAVQMMKEHYADDSINAGNLTLAIHQCRNIWASLPGSPYGQHTQKYALLEKAYLDAGGKLA